MLSLAISNNTLNIGKNAQVVNNEPIDALLADLEENISKQVKKSSVATGNMDI